MDKLAVVKRGLFDGLKITWELTKVMVPVYFIITFLQYTPAIDWMVRVSEPITSLVGLPGEAALPLVLANAINTYPALPAIMAFPFTTKQITILATMILLCHSIPIEAVIAKKSGANPVTVVGIRALMALFAGVLLNIIL